MSEQQQSEPTLLEIALFVQREEHRLPHNYRGFAASAVRCLTSPALTFKQREYLKFLFDKLGGKIT